MSGAFDHNRDSAEVVAAQPLDLAPGIPPSAEFPLDRFPDKLAKAISAIAGEVQVPVPLAAQSVLAVCALAAQARFNITMPRLGTFPPSLALFTVAASGERKSTADTKALAPLNDYEESLEADYQERMARFETDVAAHAAAVGKAKSKKGNDAADTREIVKQELESLGAKPQEPMKPFLTVDESTAPAIAKLLDIAYPSQGLFNDDGAGMIQGYSFQEENKAATGAVLSRLWDGKPIKRARVGDDMKVLRGRRLTVHMMIQPKMALRYFADRALRDQGLFSRILVTWPDTLRGSRKWEAADPDREAAIEEYQARVDGLLRIAFNKLDHATHRLDFDAVELQADAMDLFTQFHDRIETHIAPAGSLEPISDVAAKMPQQAVRLAAVVAYFSNGAELFERGITKAAMQCGVALAQFYLREALRLYNGGTVDEESELANELLEFIKAKGFRTVGKRFLNQYAPKACRPAKILNRSLEILQSAGWLQPIPSGAKMKLPSGEEKFYREAFTVVRSDA